MKEGKHFPQLVSSATPHLLWLLLPLLTLELTSLERRPMALQESFRHQIKIAETHSLVD